MTQIPLIQDSNGQWAYKKQGLGEPISAATVTAIATGVMSLYQLGASYNKGVENDRAINGSHDADVFGRAAANQRYISERLAKGEIELVSKQINIMRAGGTLNGLENGLGTVADWAGLATSLASMGTTLINADTQKSTAQAKASIADSQAKAAASQARQQELINQMAGGKSETGTGTDKDNTVLYAVVAGVVLTGIIGAVVVLNKKKTDSSKNANKK